MGWGCPQRARTLALSLSGTAIWSHESGRSSDYARNRDINDVEWFTKPTLKPVITAMVHCEQHFDLIVKYLTQNSIPCIGREEWDHGRRANILDGSFCGNRHEISAYIIFTYYFILFPRLTLKK